jgi:hypothetical protein
MELVGFDDPLYSDVKIVLAEPESRDLAFGFDVQTVILGSKVVLASKSDYFRTLWRSGNPLP